MLGNKEVCNAEALRTSAQSSHPVPSSQSLHPKTQKPGGTRWVLTLIAHHHHLRVLRL
jgi:hypothetical protein